MLGRPAGLSLGRSGSGAGGRCAKMHFDEDDWPPTTSRHTDVVCQGLGVSDIYIHWGHADPDWCWATASPTIERTQLAQHIRDASGGIAYFGGQTGRHPPPVPAMHMVILIEPL
ncbi:hypothetical protein TW95_gp0487 [Pandoravirus inopinatum]|uniref:Uncharacterized protein n=1 Tax=Pandoravirus inopinatum TaxID=1605721 RepID=A0A0B5J8W2_9VIRU|nr:hypothetical protein TW95_gp0487 [Pandoravirus inopinatum]AJF97221.1 hypothetical protein [Pandoravirus inopinatum]